MPRGVPQRLGTRLAVVCAIFVACGAAAGTVLATQPRFCTQMAGATGVHVSLGLTRLAAAVDAATSERGYFERTPAERHRELQRLVRADGIRQVRICADGRCRRASVAELVNDDIAVAGDHRGPGPVHVEVVVERLGQPIQRATADVRLNLWEPNGHGCGEFWSAERTLQDSRLTMPSA